MLCFVAGYQIELFRMAASEVRRQTFLSLCVTQQRFVLKSARATFQQCAVLAKSWGEARLENKDTKPFRWQLWRSCGVIFPA
jgi:hypothetical protein